MQSMYFGATEDISYIFYTVLTEELYLTSAFCSKLKAKDTFIVLSLLSYTFFINIVNRIKYGY